MTNPMEKDSFLGSLAGTRILVTGGTRGIGFAAAKAFCAAGANLFISGTAQDNVDMACKQIQIGHPCHGMASDLSRPENGVALVEAAADTLGGLDILVNNAGTVSTIPLDDISLEEWNRVMGVNLTAPFFICQAALPYLRNSSQASIINLSSIAGQTGGLAGSPAYAAAKAGIIGMTRNLARQLAPDRIRVNAVAPADIETDMTAGWPDELRNRLIGITPQARFGTVDEVTGAILFLASAQASFITGQTLSVNGGAYMS